MNGPMAMLQENHVAPHHAIGAAVRTGIGVPAYFPDSLRVASRLIELADGDRLFHQGAAALACYRLVRGAVRLETSQFRRCISKDPFTTGPSTSASRRNPCRARSPNSLPKASSLARAGRSG